MDLDCNTVNYLMNRELGFIRNCYGFRQNLTESLIERMRCTDNNMQGIYTNIGSTFSCKFSKNKNNLHIVACSNDDGEVIIQNTRPNKNKNEYMFHSSEENFFQNYCRTILHNNAIFNLAWAEPSMKFVTASGDHTSKVFNLLPSGDMTIQNTFNYNASVKTVMFCPGSSDIFCGGSQDGSIKVWDARVNQDRFVIGFLGLEHHIPNAHGIYIKQHSSKKTFKSYGLSSVIFQNDLNIISCSSSDPAINVWDLRKSYRQVKGNSESLPLKKYYSNNTRSRGFVDLVLNPQSSLLYASGHRDAIFCFSLDSSQRTPIHRYTGHTQETNYSKISISHDGKYIFSGCTKNTGLIWTTELPHNEKPLFMLNQKLLDDPYSYGYAFPPNFELGSSDWCADPTTYPKLVTSGDSLPLVWTVLEMEDKCTSHKFIKTPEGKTKKSFFKNISTVPIKLNTELEEKCRKETEENMKNWHLQEPNLTKTNQIKKTKIPWNFLIENRKSKSFTLLSPELNTLSDQQISEVASSSSTSFTHNVVTPKSQKRKKSISSTKNLIEHYLIQSKREKLDTVDEN